MATYDTTTSLGRVLEKTRQLTDEPSTNVKYTDAHLLGFVRSAYDLVMQDLNSQSDNPIIVRHDIAVTPDNQTYVLPPIVGEILQLAKIDSGTDLVEWETPIRSFWNPSGPGVTFEGNVVRFSPIWRSTDTLRLSFVPTGDMEPHYGTAGAVVAGSITLAATPTLGNLDKREAAYAGSVVRVVSGTGVPPQQERTIASYNAATRVATLTVDFDPVPSGTIVYEVVPFMYPLLEMVVSFYSASLVLSGEGDAKRIKTVEKKYAELMRALRLRLSNLENRVGDRFQHDTPEGTNFGSWSLGHWG